MRQCTFASYYYLAFFKWCMSSRVFNGLIFNDYTWLRSSFVSVDGTVRSSSGNEIIFCYLNSLCLIGIVWHRA
jgi:hypothetical protein